MTKLLIVDDSALMRRLLADIFGAAGEFEVEIARNGAEALDKLVAFKPDVVTLDVHMPEMDGLACLDQIMILRPCPVVMVSSLTDEGAEETLEALALGAVDFIAKPKGAVSLEIGAITDDLVEKVRSASKARIPGATRLRERVRARASQVMAGQQRKAMAQADAAPPRSIAALPGSRPRTVSGLVLVGCSTGGPPALDALLGALPQGFPWPIVIAQHMPATFTGPLARRLDHMCALNVQEIDGTTPLLAGHAYIARGAADLILSHRAGTLVAKPAPINPDYFWHPSVDRMVESAMRLIEPERLIGVLMTGMGNDGAAAMGRLREAGGLTIAEAESSAVVWGMPGALVQAGGATLVRPLDEIAAELLGLLNA